MADANSVGVSLGIRLRGTAQASVPVQVPDFTQTRQPMGTLLRDLHPSLPVSGLRSTAGFCQHAGPRRVE